MSKAFVSDLTIDQLNRAVGKIEGVLGKDGRYTDEFCDSLTDQDGGLWADSWAMGGPIIEREKIDLIYRSGEWVAEIIGDKCCIERRHRNPLVAAMQCFVVSRLGDEVEVYKGRW